MPQGVLQWLDTETGEGRVMGSGRRYAVRVEDVDARARYPGARVQFDVDHTAAGDVASGVALREGTRVAPRQRRFGDLVGARTVEAKADEPDAEIEIGRDRVRHPMRVAQWWAEHVAGGHLDDAVRLYSPTAVLHTAGRLAVGPDPIRRALSGLAIFGRAELPEMVAGDGDAIRVRWSAADDDTDPVESHLVVEHGEIVEQWHGEVRTIIDATTGLGPIDLSVEGRVSTQERNYALDKVARATRSLSEPIRYVAIRLERLADPAREHPARTRATVDIDGEPVRAHVSGRTMTEAIDLLEDRLADQIRHRASHRRALRRRGPTSPPGEWRHGDRPERPRSGPRIAPEDRAVVRRPTWSAEPCTLDEAVFDLDALDLDFLLFIDLWSGQDAVVHRRPDGQYAVRLAAGFGHGQDIATVAAVGIEPLPTPLLTFDEARQHLDDGDEDWVFYVDADNLRGQVLYRRDDGHDGLITPRADVLSGR